MKLDSIGLIVNPAAGRGREANLEAARRAVQALNASRVLAGPGELGLAAVAGAVPLSISSQGRLATQELARQMAQAGVQAVVVVGGDGTLSDVAFALHDLASPPAILGIGAGSINAGDLVTCLAQDAGRLSGAEFHSHAVTGLIAGVDGRRLALAFNDAVISTTLVGTRDGTLIDLNASQFMEGRRVPDRAQPVGREGALVRKISASGESLVIARDAQVGTVIVGFSQEECFFGKAIAGSVILASLAGAPAGCLVCDQPLVQTRLGLAELWALEPLHTSFASLASGETLRVKGLGPPAVLCADGNPLARLEPQMESFFQVKTGLAQVLRLA